MSEIALAEASPNPVSPLPTVEAMITDAHYPCVGAKSALAGGRLSIVDGGDFGDLASSPRLLCRIARFLSARPSVPGLHSLAIQFGETEPMTEEQFERTLWVRLQSLSDADRASGAAYAPGVSSDPDHADFAISLCRTAFFVVGLHPGASRKARRFARPTLVFNPHAQFEQLKASGKYDRMQEIIRKRDLVFSGSLNPVLSRHGESSAARQYSGRAVEPGWQCPFRDQRQAQTLQGAQ